MLSHPITCLGWFRPSSILLSVPFVSAVEAGGPKRDEDCLIIHLHKLRYFASPWFKCWPECHWSHPDPLSGTKPIAYGWSPEEIHFQHPHLSLAQIHAALTYYYESQPRVDAQIRERLQEADTLARQASDPDFRRKLIDLKQPL